MKINVFTTFPEYLQPILNLSLLARAAKEDHVSYNIIDIHNYGLGGYKRVDDTVYGGGSGMIMRPDVLQKALESNIDPALIPQKKIILTSPRGTIFNQQMAQELSKLPEIYIICNRSEGVDQRFIDHYNIEEVSIGNYILFGGEVASLAIIESVVRLLPGVIKNDLATVEESFSESLQGNLEYDHYTKPLTWEGKTVPEVLLSGHHKNISDWRMQNSRSRQRKSDK